MSRRPSRVTLYDEDFNVIHDADTPERVAEFKQLRVTEDPDRLGYYLEEK